MAAALASLYHRIRDAERPAVKVAQRLRHDPRPVRRKELAGPAKIRPRCAASWAWSVSMARVNLTVADGTSEFSWDAPVWFCDPWPHPFGLAGLEGFLHHFLVTIRAYDGYLDIEPQS